MLTKLKIAIILAVVFTAGIALGTKWSDYGAIGPGVIADGDSALVLDVSDTSLGVTGTQKRWLWSSIKTDIESWMNGEDFASLTGNVYTTGIIKGRNSPGTDITANTNHDLAELHGVMYKFTAAATVTLDAAADAGYGACASYRIRDNSELAKLDVQAGEKFNLTGTALAAGTAIEATGAGEYVTVCATTDTDGSGTDGYDVFGETSGWASE